MSILNAFTYCPKCSAAALKSSSSKSIVCTECEFEYFFNSAAAAAGMIFNGKNELLLTVRGHEPCKGKLDLPGGFVDPGETAEHALAREIKEELNLEVNSMDYFATATNEYLYKNVTYPTLDIAFICHVSDFSTLSLQDEIHDVRMIVPGEIDSEQIAFDSTRIFISMLSTD